MRKLVCALAVLALSSTLAAGSTVTPAEYAARRARVAQAIGPNAMLILMSPEPAVRNGDVDWPFRQEDNLDYLTGIAEPETTLVMIPSQKNMSEVLFVRERNPQAEMWTGRIPTFDEVRERSGVSTVASSRGVDNFVGAVLRGFPWSATPVSLRYAEAVAPEFFEVARRGDAQVWLLLTARRTATGTLTPVMQYARDLRDRYPEVSIRDATTILRDIREVKSPAEVALLRKATEISAAAQIAGMRRALTATNERQVQATIEYTFRDLGACCWGYPSIVAAGANATTLHYQDDNAAIRRGDLLLADVGADYEGYTADVTRTYPVSGQFTADQRAVYDAVYRASQRVIAIARPGRHWQELHETAEKSLGEDLLKLDLITQNTPDQVKLYFPHGIGHPIGLQVHDVFRAVRPLEAGMVLAIEPGIYVRKDDLMASSFYRGLNDAGKKRVDAAIARFSGIGVRLEDNVLVTAGDPEILTIKAPRSAEEIERVLGERARQ